MDFSMRNLLYELMHQGKFEFQSGYRNTKMNHLKDLIFGMGLDRQVFKNICMLFLGLGKHLFKSSY